MKPGSLTLEQRRKREEQVKKLLDEGASYNDIGRAIGVSSQSAYAFCKVRGWTTKNTHPSKETKNE